MAAAPGRPPLPAAGIARVGLAEVAYQHGELEAALEHVTEGIALCRQLAYPRSLAAGLATLARIRQAEGDLSGALEVLGEYRRGAPSLGVTNLLDPVPALRARLLLAQDLPDRALALLDRLHALAAAQGRTGGVIEIQALPSPWPRPATRPPRWPPWPRRSRSPPARATCGSSPTRARP